MSENEQREDGDTEEAKIPRSRLNQVIAERDKYAREGQAWREKYEGYDTDGVTKTHSEELTQRDSRIKELEGTISLNATRRTLRGDGLDPDSEVGEYVLGRYSRLKADEGEQKPSFEDWFQEFADTSSLVKSAREEAKGGTKDKEDGKEEEGTKKDKKRASSHHRRKSASNEQTTEEEVRDMTHAEYLVWRKARRGK